MKLYYAPAACSQAVHIALLEAGLSADLVKVDLSTHLLDDGSDYFAINPRGYVPLLELDDGSRHTEVAALLQYMGDLAPASGLIPQAGSVQRLEVVKWISFVSSELHKVFSPWLWHKETADSTRKAVKDKLALRFAELDQVLGERDFLAGGSFTAADAYGFTIVNWAPMLGMSLKAYPQLQAWLARVALRPAVQAALTAEGLVKA
ncbi:MAG TPA: glutathione transferase GstA [Ramlibacter sp.]|nr:glutathione transferase GstA [Ramlibacter sp.]